MPVLLFSGGIDSTTLAFDVALNPWRYGISGDGSLVGGARPVLGLLSHGPSNAEHRRGIEGLVRDISASARLDVVHRWVSSKGSMSSSRHCKMSAQGHGSLYPLAAQYDADLDSLPYTPWWMAWLASVASNWIGVLEAKGLDAGCSEFTAAKVMFGFQWDGPIWDQQDRHILRPCDTSPEFIAALNSLSKATGDSVTFSAPFLDQRMDRRMIVQLAMSIGVPLSATSSCVQGWGVACGKCHQCLIRHAVFRGLEVGA